MTDSKIISNQYSECNYVAKKFGVFVDEVYKAKRILKTNVRKDIYAYLENIEKAT